MNGSNMPNKEEIQVEAMKRIVARMKELAEKHGTKILLLPSPSRITPQGEYSDYDTAEYYRKWLDSGVNLEEYAKHQEQGFPLFELARYTGRAFKKQPDFLLLPTDAYEGYFGLNALKARDKRSKDEKLG